MPPTEKAVSSTHFPLLDSIRGLAVAAVVLIHVALVTGALDGTFKGNAIQALGTYALPVLFALSGFLIYRPFVRSRLSGARKPRASHYLKNRFNRIVPGYWFALTALGLFPGLTGVFTGDFWRFYGFSQIYSLDTYELGIPQAWSLCVEVAFYLLLPVWALAIRRLSGQRARPELAILLAASAASVGTQVLASQHLVPYLVGQSIAGQGIWLMLGMGLAVIDVSRERWPPALQSLLGRQRTPLYVAMALSSWLGLTLLVPPGGLFANVAVITTVVSNPLQTVAKAALGTTFVLSVLVPCILTSQSQNVKEHALLGHPLLARFGTISYGVYLWHLTLSSLIGLNADPFHYHTRVGLNLVGRVPALDTLVLFAATLGASAVIATLSYRFVERPWLRRGGSGGSLARTA